MSYRLFPTSVLRAAALAAWLAASGSPAEEVRTPAARSFEIRPARGPIEVDGVLDEAAWADALAFDLPYEWTPGDNVDPPVSTEVLATYDNDRLYVGWRCHDPRPDQIRAHLMDRDAINTLVQDDYVGILLDTFNDERRAFQLRVNPLGVQADAFNSENEGVEDWAFDLIWDSAGRIGAEGYAVEIAIPFDQLRFPAGGGEMMWGLSVERSYPRSVRHRITSHPRDRDRGCIACQFDKVTGFEGLRPGRNLEVVPTLTAAATERLDGFPDGVLASDGEDFEPGVSARWGLTPSLTLSATVNPDFSQVEADVAQLEVNTRFALFFPEQRPFFLEGSTLFATPMQAVFTRTVVDPDWGLKLTGKQGKNLLGVLVTEDTVNSLIFPSNQSSRSTVLADTVTTGVLRYSRDVGRNSSLGVLWAGRHGEDYENDVYGVDGFWRFDQSNTLRYQFLRSDTAYPSAVAAEFGQDAEAFSGDALALDFEHVSRAWFVALLARDIEPGFRADSGFIPRVDQRRARLLALRRLWGEEDDWYTRLNIGTIADRTETHGGELSDETFELFANVSGPLQSFLEVSLIRNRRSFRGVNHDDLQSVWFNSQVQPTGSVKLSLLAVVGDEVDFASNRVADSSLFLPALEAKLGRHVNLRLDHTFQRLESPGGGDIFTANLSQARVVYNLNVRTFVRATFQYLDLNMDQDAAEQQTLFTQLLYSYKINPRTVIFAGYSDNRLGVGDIRLTQTDRTFFLKLGYAWTL